MIKVNETVNIYPFNHLWVFQVYPEIQGRRGSRSRKVWECFVIWMSVQSDHSNITQYYMQHDRRKR